VGVVLNEVLDRPSRVVGSKGNNCSTVSLKLSLSISLDVYY